MTTDASGLGSSSRPTISANLRLRAVGVGAAVVAAAIVWAIAKAADVEFLVKQGEGNAPTEVGLGIVIVMALVAALLGWGVLILLERFLSRGTAIWTGLAVLVLLLSFAPVLSADATTGTKLSLVIMHVVVAASVIPLFHQTAPRTAR
ncbi:DUF6069 family protein [Frankia sp. Mgl5]|uniref:DUF6069 family protein n=1 Tax=Frankia sp. Mgl5 TaxID=2933793 RepID=UPI0020100082|nr:DUF6069 family protein [Frankia sp. Mgl5]MCK9929746.1 DUF6069 family protein [Frankia sp. Mgl5]